MSTPIDFDGTDYASAEAMPPDVREKYESMHQLLARLHGREQRRQADEPLTPAWGGPRPQGSVPVAVEFDPVTSLGPALAVLEHDGIRIFPNFGPPRPNVLVRYRDGFAFKAGGKDVHTWRYDEVAVVQSNVWMSSGEHTVWTNHEYALMKRSGEKLILDDGLKGIENGILPIKQAVFALLEPPLAQQYQAGATAAFGPVTIQRQGGLQLDGKSYAWDAIQDIRVERGRFKVALRDGKRHEVRASAIPNIELVCQLIGLKLQWPDLAYF